MCSVRINITISKAQNDTKGKNNTIQMTKSPNHNIYYIRVYIMLNLNILSCKNNKIFLWI